MKSLSDSSLFDLIKMDNHMAYTMLIDRYWEDLYRHIFLKIKNDEDAKDIVQDIFLGLWKNRSSITTDEKESIAPYLFVAAKYAIISRFSSPNVSIIDERSLTESINLPAASKTDDKIMIEELREIVACEVSKLPDRLQVPYRLSREQELTIREIALKLSLSEQTVKNNITTALNIIRLKLGKYNAEPAVPYIIALTALLHHK